MLNENQRRAVSVTFRTVEQYLFAIERMLATQDYDGILYGLKNDVPVMNRDIFEEMISEAMAKIRAIAEQFSLEKTRKHARQNISAELSYCWEILQGVKAKRLKGYGDVDSSLENTLDPQIDALIDILGEMQLLLQGATKHER